MSAFYARDPATGLRRKTEEIQIFPPPLARIRPVAEADEPDADDGSELHPRASQAVAVSGVRFYLPDRFFFIKPHFVIMKKTV